MSTEQFESPRDSLVLRGKKNKTYIAAVGVAVLVLAAIVFWFWLQRPTSLMPPPADTEVETPVETSKEENTYGTLPGQKSLTNPLEKTPELNPLDKINPFKDTYKNPFE